jgi:hypothetical protein
MWVAVADYCLILKLSPISSSTVAGSRSSPNTMACPVSIHSCQPDHHRLNPFPLRRTSWYYSYRSLLGTQYSNHLMHSHSGGPSGTIAIHSWDSCAHSPGIVGRSLLVLVITLSRLGYLFTWSMSILTTTDSSWCFQRLYRNSFTWSLLLLTTTTDFFFTETWNVPDSCCC